MMMMMLMMVMMMMMMMVMMMMMMMMAMMVMMMMVMMTMMLMMMVMSDEQRLLRSLRGPGGGGPGAGPAGGWGGDSYHLGFGLDGGGSSDSGYRRRIRLGEQWACAARHCGRRWGCTVETVLLATVAVALVRAGPPQRCDRHLDLAVPAGGGFWGGGSD